MRGRPGRDLFLTHVIEHALHDRGDLVPLLPCHHGTPRDRAPSAKFKTLAIKG